MLRAHENNWIRATTDTWNMMITTISTANNNNNNKHEIKELQKTAMLVTAYILESTDIQVQNIYKGN